MKIDLSYIIAIVIHVVIGILIYFNESLSKIYFWAILVFFSYRIIMTPKKYKSYEVLKACAYIVGAELLLRMTKGAISYEACKYLLIVFSVVGAFYSGLNGRGWPYLLYLMLLIPSIFVASTTLSYDANFSRSMAFVLSGPVSLGFIALYCYEKKVTYKQMSNILLLVLLPIISMTAYIYFYNPSVEEVLSNTASNRQTSGGFGANQVATILGLGMILTVIRLFENSKNIWLKLINASLFILIAFRALVTFSRGGVIAAVLSIIVFIFFYYKVLPRIKKARVISVVVLLLIAMAATWYISSNQTSGFIDLRYANKDHLGREKSDITTGRGELFMNELEGFLRRPFLGIGSSRAIDRRKQIEGQGITSHSEISRLLAEHGILGIVILVILCTKPLYLRKLNPNNFYFFAFLAFWFATINHSSMRIGAPAFFYAIALLNVVNEKNPLHRKRLEG